MHTLMCAYIYDVKSNIIKYVAYIAIFTLMKRFMRHQLRNSLYSKTSLTRAQ